VEEHLWTLLLCTKIDIEAATIKDIEDYTGNNEMLAMFIAFRV